MTDKVSIAPGFGCAPLPRSTGRISQRLPFLEYRSPKSPNVTLWLSKDNNKKSPTGVLKPLFVDIPNKHPFPSDGNEFQFPLVPKTARQFAGHQQNRRIESSYGNRSDLELSFGKNDVFRRHTAPEPARSYTPFVTATRPRTCQTWSSDNIADVYSGRASVDSEQLSSSRAGLSRYTPLPAIGKIGRAESLQEQQLMYVHQSLNNLDLQETWTLPSANNPSTTDRKLPPILRPLVRSRTFTILNIGEDKDQAWVMDEKEEEDGERSLDLFILVTTPDGLTEENHFDSEDTFRDVFRFVFKEDDDVSDWRFVTEDDDPPKVFTDFSQTLADAHVQNKTRFLLQRSFS